MKLALPIALLLAVPFAAFAQDEEIPFPYESPEDITVRSGWEDIALDAYAISYPPPTGPGAEEDVLTNGLNRENEAGQFVAWQGLAEPLEIVVELDEPASDISSFRIFWAVDGTGEGGAVADFVPETVVLISQDGVDYTEVGIATTEDLSEAGSSDFTVRHSSNDLTLDDPVEAQFIQFLLPDPPPNVMCSEATVLRRVEIPENAVNIAVEKSYVTDPPGNDGSRPDDGIRLTDGALSEDASTGTTGWAGITSADQISITIDLGGVQDRLVAFRAWYNAWEMAFVFVVGTVYVDVSEDGDAFTTIGLAPKLYDHDDNPSFSNVPYLIVPEQPVRARYVRFWTQGSDDNYWDSFASEFEVYQGVATHVESWSLF